MHFNLLLFCCLHVVGLAVAVLSGGLDALNGAIRNVQIVARVITEDAEIRANGTCHTMSYPPSSSSPKLTHSIHVPQSTQINTPQHTLPHNNLRIRHPHRSSPRSSPYPTRPNRIPSTRTLAPSKYWRVLYIVFSNTCCEWGTLFEWDLECCCCEEDICVAAWRCWEWCKGFVWVSSGVVLERWATVVA